MSTVELGRFTRAACVPLRSCRCSLRFTVEWRRLFTATASEMGWIWVCVQRIRRRMRLDRFRELGRQYPVFCFLLLVLLLATVLLNRYYTHTHTHTCPLWVFCKSVLQHIFLYFIRYIHIIMVFWSFLAGVVTFYCSLGPESLLPNIFGSIKPKTKVGLSGTTGRICQTCQNNDIMCKSSNKRNYLPCLVVIPTGTVSPGPQLCRLWKNQMQKTQVRHLQAPWCSGTGGYGTLVSFQGKDALFHIFTKSKYALE